MVTGQCPNKYTNTTMINSRINVGLSKLILVRLLGALFPSAFDENSFNFLNYYVVGYLTRGMSMSMVIVILSLKEESSFVTKPKIGINK